MKIIKKLISILLILGCLFTTVTPAFAYSGGLLNGIALKHGYDINDTRATTNVLTDGNETTNITVEQTGSGYWDTVWYKFSNPINLTHYQLKSSPGITIKYYDNNGVQITGDGSPVINGTKTTRTLNNIYYVALVNTSAANVTVSEFDVFGTIVPDYSGGLLDGKTAYQGISVGEGTTLRNATIDNDATTYNSISNNNVLWVQLDAPATITSYSYSGNLSTGVYLRLYDSNKTQLRSVSPTSNNVVNTVINSTANVTYVAIYNGTGTTLTVNELEVFGTAGSPPPIVKTDVTNVDVTGITENVSNVSWVNPTGYSGVTFSGAKIYVDGTLKYTANPSSTSYSLTGLTASNSYTVRVAASWSDGTESTGITKVFNTLEPPDTTAPANVTNLVATPTFNSISLSWTNPTDQDFAKVNVYEDGIYKKSVTATEGSSAYFSNLDPETTYSFKVTSVDFTGNESSGAVIEVKTLPLPEIKKIKNLDATSKFDRVKLSWELPESEYFHHVNIYRKVVEEESFFESLFSLGVIKVSAADTEDEYKPMFETNGTYWTDLTVEPETKYEYKLTSENVDGRESEEGVVVQVSTPEEPKPVLKDAEFQAATNGDYVIKWSEPTTGNVKIKVGGNDYKTVPANLKTYTIPKSDLAYTTIGDPDVTIQPVTERGTEGDVVSSPKMNLPFSAKDLVESGNGLLWLVGPFILLALAFLLVPKFRELILAAFRGKGKLIDTGERRSTTGDKELNLEPKGESVRLAKELRESRAPRMKSDRAEREVRVGKEPRHIIRESRTPRVSRRGR
jgi:hypothetical protein